MKKLLLAGFVVATFIIYSVRQHNEGPVHIAPPTSISQNAPSSGTPSATTASVKYKDGNYTGTTEDAFYGSIQVKAVISGGKLTDVQFLQAPNDSETSISINSQADPDLKQEAIQAQSAKVDTVSGATQSSMAFVQSLTSALAQAHA